jgi:dihydrofolate reductase
MKRKIISHSLISANGIVPDGPHAVGFGDYWDDEAYLLDNSGLFEACDAILFGRTTYEIFAKLWAGVKDGTHPYAARVNAIRKYVFSSTLEHAEWNNTTIIRGDVVAEATKLKQQDGGHLLVFGNGLLGRTLLKHRLIDVLDLGVHPVMLNEGRSFSCEGQALKLKLTATTVYPKIVKLSYETQGYP